MSAKSTAWIIGTVLASVIVSVIVWFTLISPQIENAGKVRDEAEQTAQHNDIIELNIARLRAEDAKIPEYEAQIAAVRTKIPTDVELAQITRTFADLAEKHDLTITMITNSDGVVVPPPISAEEAAQGAAQEDAGEASETEGDPADEEQPAPVPVEDGVVAELPLVTFAGLSAYPITATVVGTVDDAEAFVRDLQTEVERAIVVAGWSQIMQLEQEFTGGNPETELGDVALQLDVLVFSLLDLLNLPELPEITPVDPGELPSSDRNALEPVITDDVGRGGSSSDDD